jgi:alcohol dehydrogenase (cytochrome c)
MESRAGVETWIAGSYDPDLNLTYWGTAQSKPWSFLNRNTTPFDRTLYSSSTLALNADTGKLAAEIWDVPAGCGRGLGAPSASPR